MKLPEVFQKKMEQLLGEEYKDFVTCFNKQYSGGIRINTLKTTPEEFIECTPFGLRRIPWIKKGFYYDSKEQPAKHPYYFAGLYYIQEPSAMTPANLLPIHLGDKVLDLCAAPGGKSTELAAKLNGTGLLIANDISNSRAKALLKNIEVFGVKNAVVTSETPAKLAETFEGYFDKILVDAPCSGEGMFRKSPAIMKNWEQYGVEYYNKLQKEILPYAVKMLKPGGMLLYSTCTFSPEEDEETVAWLLSEYKELILVPPIDSAVMQKVDGSVMTESSTIYNGSPLEERQKLELKNVSYQGFSFGHPEWITESLKEKIKVQYDSIKNCIRFWPHKIGGEGHFLALFQKSKGEKIKYSTFVSAAKEQKLISKEAQDFLKHIKWQIPSSRIVVREERLYLLPEGMLDMKGLRILRSGLLLGEQKKGRFEPSQALACALKAEEYDNIYNLSASDEDVIRYLKCEAIELKKPCKDGYVLILVDNYSLGWGKVKNKIFKNKYLPGWRMM